MKKYLPLTLLLSLLSLSLPSLADEGEIAIDFNLPHLTESKTEKLSDHRGSVVLVDFWASWCGPCRASFPAYDKLRKELQAKYGKNKDGSEKFEILAINVDADKKEAIDFLNKVNVSFPILNENTGGGTQQNYQLLAMPTSFLIDPDGIIHVQHSGFSGGYINLIRAETTKLLNQQGS